KASCPTHPLHPPTTPMKTTTPPSPRQTPWTWLLDNQLTESFKTQRKMNKNKNYKSKT
ncbi:Hypothetical protein FKW44_022522, partial [Caligus rogercresseyi]